MSRFHCLTSLLMLIAILAGATNHADASPASSGVGALGAAAAKKVVNGAANDLKGWYCFPQDGPIGPTCIKPR